MEAVDGANLEEYLKAGNAIADKERFMAALESVVRHLHDVVGMAHNDINPENIMGRRADGMRVLIDFGTARPLAEKLDGPSAPLAGWKTTTSRRICHIDAAANYNTRLLPTWTD
ncbi:hypothetical protein N657DRAFT_629579 [Parathielavia appendiculata]|uniref:Protein kinase domain-containing protein n=1 Tax=Parathielavia appendiculata TaxID=2587402 RepID=A0AAN6Z835_9PEZI|nr:hypothetical protein N657DRAFT_629579 [Parathielavia appendiculata]